MSKGGEKQKKISEIGEETKLGSKRNRRANSRTLDLFNNLVSHSEESSKNTEITRQAKSDVEATDSKDNFKTEIQTNKESSTEKLAIKSMVEEMVTRQVNEKLNELQKNGINQKHAIKQKKYDTKHISVHQYPRILTFRKTENESFRDTLETVIASAEKYREQNGRQYH